MISEYGAFLWVVGVLPSHTLSLPTKENWGSAKCASPPWKHGFRCRPLLMQSKVVMCVIFWGQHTFQNNVHHLVCHRQVRHEPLTFQLLQSDVGEVSSAVGRWLQFAHALQARWKSPKKAVGFEVWLLFAYLHLLEHILFLIDNAFQAQISKKHHAKGFSLQGESVWLRALWILRKSHTCCPRIPQIRFAPDPFFPQSISKQSTFREKSCGRNVAPWRHVYADPAAVIFQVRQLRKFFPGSPIYVMSSSPGQGIRWEKAVGRAPCGRFSLYICFFHESQR